MLSACWLTLMRAGPYFFMSASLIDDLGTANTSLGAASALGGTLVSSLHKVKDIAGGGDVALFVFGDLSVKIEGLFRLKFSLFEVRGKEVEWIQDVTSQPFQVYSAKTWPGMGESTPLTRMLSDQGIRLRLRKEPRLRLNPKGPASDDYAPRRYTPRRSRSAIEQDIRRESGASTMAPTPQRNQQGSDESGDNSFDNGEEEQQQQDIAAQSPLAPVGPPPYQPMAPFIAQQNESRKRELSMSSYHSTPPAAGGAGGLTTNEPMPKRTRPDEDSTQPLAAGQGVYGQYPTPQSIDPPARMYGNQDVAMQMYPPGQLGPAQPQQQFGRPPSYSHGPPGYMETRQGGGYNLNERGVGYDLSEREVVSMSPGMYRGRSHPNYTMGMGQQQQYGEGPMQQSMLNPAFTNVQGMQYQHMMQQRTGQSLPLRGMMNEGYDYASPPDPAIDPLLVGQGPQQVAGMPRMSVQGMGGQPPQFYGQRGVPSPNPMMQPGMQSTSSPELAGTQQFYGNMAAPQGIGMREPRAAGQGIGFRGGLTPHDGVGFRETSSYASPIPSHHSGVSSHHSGVPSHHSGETVIAGDIDMGHGEAN